MFHSITGDELVGILEWRVSQSISFMVPITSNGV